MQAPTHCCREWIRLHPVQRGKVLGHHVHIHRDGGGYAATQPIIQQREQILSMMRRIINSRSSFKEQGLLRIHDLLQMSGMKVKFPVHELYKYSGVKKINAM